MDAKGDKRRSDGQQRIVNASPIPYNDRPRDGAPSRGNKLLWEEALILIPVVLVIVGILALVLYLEKRDAF
jgi:hypothetical protein